MQPRLFILESDVTGGLVDHSQLWYIPAHTRLRKPYTVHREPYTSRINTVGAQCHTQYTVPYTWTVNVQLDVLSRHMEK